jgi:hypothetical protein
MEIYLLLRIARIKVIAYIDRFHIGYSILYVSLIMKMANCSNHAACHILDSIEKGLLPILNCYTFDLRELF